MFRDDLKRFGRIKAGEYFLISQSRWLSGAETQSLLFLSFFYSHFCHPERSRRTREQLDKDCDFDCGISSVISLFGRDDNYEENWKLKNPFDPYNLWQKNFMNYIIYLGFLLKLPDKPQLNA